MLFHYEKLPFLICNVHGPIARYVKLRPAYAPGKHGTFSPPPTSKETASKRSLHASQHVREARAVMHVGIANPRWAGKKTLPVFPAHTQPAILRIWQEAHGLIFLYLITSLGCFVHRLSF